ncbi:MAG: host attachment protein [Myxococcota bacterium]
MWILVADSSRARIFDATRKFSAPGEFEFSKFSEVDDLVNARGRARNQDINTDKPGRMADRTGRGDATTGQRSAVGGKEEPKETEAKAFAQRVNDRLEDAANDGDYDEVVVIAAPRFLGMLRDSRASQVDSMVIEEIGKDFTKLSAHDLKDRLPELL